MTYELGHTWRDRYINGSQQTNKIIRVKPTKYGYRVQMFNSYVTLYYVRIEVNPDNSAKVRVKQARNYSPVQTTTYYFAPGEGREIKSPDNSTRKELSIYKQLRGI